MNNIPVSSMHNTKVNITQDSHTYINCMYKGFHVILQNASPGAHQCRWSNLNKFLAQGTKNTY